MTDAVTIAATILVGAVAYQYMKPESKRLASQNARQQTPGGQSTGLPSRMWIDRPVNTVLRNDAQYDEPHRIDAYLKSTYATEAAQHPGVRLVAGSAGG